MGCHQRGGQGGVGMAELRFVMLRFWVRVDGWGAGEVASATPIPPGPPLR